MSARLQVLVIALHLGIAVLVLCAVTLLATLERPITPLVAGIFGTILGLAGGSGAAAAALGTALNGKSAVAPEYLLNQQQLLREGMRLVAGQDAMSDRSIVTAGDADSPVMKAPRPG